MAQFDLTNKYFIKTTPNGNYQDITTLVNGVRILSIDGFFEQGKAINTYTAQWVNSPVEDFLITTNNDQDFPIVIRENVDISITFIVGKRYVTGGATIDVATQHDTFIDWLTNKDVWIKSTYAQKEVHCFALDKYAPTVVKLQRGENSYIMGTLTLHALSPSVGV